MSNFDDLVFVNAGGETFTPTISGAISTWLWEVCSAARRRGAEPLVITRTAREKPWDWSRTRFIEYPYPRLLGLRGMGRMYSLQKRLMGWGHVHQSSHARLLAEAIRQAGNGHRTLFLHNDMEMVVFLRRVFPDATIIHLAHNNNPCDWRFRRRFAASVTSALAVSDACATWNADYFGIPVATLYNGVDVDLFHPAPGPSAGPPVINFVGTTDRRKGLDILLRACLHLAERTTSFSLQILGRNFYDRSEPDDFQNLVAGLCKQLEEKGVAVRRPGWITRAQLPDELRKAHIHVTSSRVYESFGLATVEAMACGLAVVGSRTGGTPEVIGGNGMVFESENSRELAAHLERLVLDESLRRDYAIKARRRAEEFTWDRTWQQIKKMLPG